MHITRKQLRQLIKEELWGNPAGVWDGVPTLTGHPRWQPSPEQESVLSQVVYSPDLWNLSRDSDNSDQRAAWLSSAEQGDMGQLTSALNQLYAMRDEIEKSYFSGTTRGLSWLDKVDDWTTPIAYTSAVATKNPIPIAIDAAGDAARSGVEWINSRYLRKLDPKLSNVQYAIFRLEDAYRQKESGTTPEPVYSDPLGHRVDIE